MAKRNTEGKIILMILGFVFNAIFSVLKLVSSFISDFTNTEHKNTNRILRKNELHIPNTDYNEIILEKIIFQYFETLYILKNTHDYQVLSSRLRFLNERIIEVKRYYNRVDNKKMNLIVSSVINEYTKLYYDRTFTGMEHHFFNLNKEQLVDAYYTIAINVLNNYYNFNIISIDDLKTKNGKINRIEKVKQRLSDFEFGCSETFYAKRPDFILKIREQETLLENKIHFLNNSKKQY